MQFNSKNSLPKVKEMRSTMRIFLRSMFVLVAACSISGTTNGQAQQPRNRCFHDAIVDVDFVFDGCSLARAQKDDDLR